MNQVDIHFCLKVLDRGLRNSLYYLQSGRSAQSYVNIDNALLGVAYGASKDVPQYEVMDGLAEQFFNKINEIEEHETVDRLAFIDKAGRGPVGLIALASLIVCKSQKEAIFVRPYKNTLRSSVEGRPLDSCEKLLIISDVATTGQTILKAANILWEKGAVVAGAVVFFDQEIGAKENLAFKDIALHSLLTRSKASESPERAGRLNGFENTPFKVFGGVI